MIKKIVLGVAFFLSIISCESDDICTDKVITPRLIIRVYDKNTPTQVKPVNNFLVIGKDAPNNEAIQFTTTDSIAVPLKMLSEETSFFLVKDAQVTNGVLTAGQQTELKIQYQPKTVFLDKGCGYRVVFENLSAQILGVSWIDSVRVLVNHLEDESKAIIHIYY